MRFVKALRLIAAAHLVSCSLAWAQELCPAGPFETDEHSIAVVMAAEPLAPVAWYAQREAAGLTKGVVASASGGYMSTGAVSLEYDAQHYVLIEKKTEREWASRSHFLNWHQLKPAKPVPNQLVEKVGDVTYTTIVIRPELDDARQIACTVNQLITPRPSPIYDPPPDTSLPVEITISAPRRCEKALWTDGYDESFFVRIGSSLNPYTDLPCETRAELESHIWKLFDYMLREKEERDAGKWHAPRVHSIAVDAADDLYLFLDPGSHRRSMIDVRKVTSSGEVTRLSEKVGEQFAVTRSLFGAFAMQTAPESVPRSINGNSGGVFVTVRSKYYEIAPTGEVTWLGGANMRHFYIAVGHDETVFEADTTSNVILKMRQDGSFAIVAGVPHRAGATDGPVGKATFNAPKGLVSDRDGNIYVADSGNHTVRRITPGGDVSTLAGKHGKRGTTDGQGASARLDSPTSIAIDSAGTLYVTNGTDNLIRKISLGGQVRTMNAQQFIGPELPVH